MEHILDQHQKVLIIAEIGVNHNGDITLAKKMIDEAHNCGADAVKFQTFNAELLADKFTPKVDYQKHSGTIDETHFDMLSRLELSKSQHFELKKYTDDLGILFMSTPYDCESAKFLLELGVKCFKTSSADLIDLRLHHTIASFKTPVILSTGMSSIKEIERTVKIYGEQMYPNLALLHCVSAYPCSDESLNLKVIENLKIKFPKINIGFSDHSVGHIASCISVGLGANIIEKHFTIDKSMDGPDHRASSNVEEFSELCKAVRKVELMLGSKEKSIQLEEQQMRQVSRKGLRVSREILPGSVITEDDIIAKRPQIGITISDFDNVIGKVVNRKLNKNEPLNWDDLD